MKKKSVGISLIIFLMFSCKTETPDMIILHTPQQEGNAIVLTWDKTNIENFEYYMIMRSSDKKQYAIINDITNKSSDAYKIGFTTFTDHAYPIEADTLYYKILAVGGNQTATSGNICYPVKNPVRIITGNVADIHCLPEQNQVSVLNNANSMYEYELKIFDLQTGTFLPERATISLPFSSGWYFWSKYDGKTEFYNYDNHFIHVYNASTLQKTTSLKVPETYSEGKYAHNGKGQIYIYNGSTLYAINRETEKYSLLYTTPTPNPFRYLYCNPAENQLYVFGYNDYIALQQDEQGNIIDEKHYNYPATFGNFKFIENSSLMFIYSNEKVKIFNLNGGISADTDLEQNPKMACRKGNDIYAIGYNYHKIYRISATDYKMTETYTTRVQPISLFISDDYLYYWGQYHYNGQYILEKIKLN